MYYKMAEMYRRFIGITGFLVILALSGVLFVSQKDHIQGPFAGKYMMLQKSIRKLTAVSDQKTSVGLESTLLIIVAYHRTGSTFTASLFQAYPGAFYIFEPLQAVLEPKNNWLTYLNGSSVLCLNLNTPGLTYLHGSSVLVHKKNHETLVEQELHNVMRCNIEHTSLNLIFHHARFAFNDSMRPLQECLWDQLNDYTRREQLKRLLYHSQHLNSRSNFTFKVKLYPFLSKMQNFTTGFENLFNPKVCQKYGLCVGKADLQRMSRNCLKRTNVIHHCKTAPVRVFKFIRISMSKAESLLDKFPSMKIIYLLRDPRAATLSSIKTRQHIISISNLKSSYCDFIKANRDSRDRLIKSHPDSLYRLQYERLALNPINVTKEMYKFVGLQFLESVEKFIVRIALSGEGRKCNYCVDRGDSKKMAEGWRTKISEETYNKINTLCLDEIREMGLGLPSFEQVKNMSYPIW